MNLLVSIPFIAGQWSLRAADAAIDASAVLFQSPSLRGSGRFVLVLVAGLCLYLFQSPSLRGSGRFLAARRGRARRERKSFNPLHCGAVVASPRAWRRHKTPLTRFNPLHCGAVVASERRAARLGGELRFQSPSLRGSGRFVCDAPDGVRCGAWFQSPSLRGSGRFTCAPHARAAPWTSGFNPLHCGAVVASRSASTRRPSSKRVSIPFIAGQWSLQGKHMNPTIHDVLFQSPSLRGSGRF